MRILITNSTLAARAGSELYVRDLALALLRRGHQPIAYSTALGAVAEDLRRATVPVIDDLRLLTDPPDIIHGQHHLDAMAAMLRFPGVPAVYMCHGWLPWEEEPPAFPSISRYIAVDDLCRERLVANGGIEPDRVDVVYNFVDLERFARRQPLPDKPATALIFSNHAAHPVHVDAIEAACARLGVTRLDRVGIRFDNVVSKPEKMLGGYDVVFAKARAALEALAVGCAVVVTDTSGFAGLVTSDNVAALRRYNFGVRTMQASAISAAAVTEALRHYDAGDAARVTDWIRAEADLGDAIDRLLGIYQRVLTSHREFAIQPPARADFEARARDASRYLGFLAPALKSRRAAEQRARQATADAERERERREQAERSRDALQAELDAARLRVGRAESRQSVLEQELEAVRGNPAWRIYRCCCAAGSWLGRRLADAGTLARRLSARR
jgi:glycosyltransferase involved in cell wall biosynthesis